MPIILELPISISSYIIISDTLKHSPERDLYIKLFSEYIEYLPIYKVAEVCIHAKGQLCESDFQIVLDLLWKCIAIFQQGGNIKSVNGRKNDRSKQDLSEKHSV